MREEKVLVRLYVCAGSSEPSLLVDAISTEITCADSNIVYTAWSSIQNKCMIEVCIRDDHY